MNEPLLLARCERGTDGVLRVLAPKIGFWIDPPAVGAWLGPGSSIGALAQLNRRFRLVLPEGVAGRVSAGVSRHRVIAVEFGQALFTLLPVSPGGGEGSPAEDLSSFGHPTGARLPAGARAIVSPTDGVFYERPTPDAPPFVRPGERIRRGQAVGLVEVMKTFNQIVYDGPGFPDEGRVVEVRDESAREVRAGDILVVVLDLDPTHGASDATEDGSVEV